MDKDVEYVSINVAKPDWRTKEEFASDVKKYINKWVDEVNKVVEKLITLNYNPESLYQNIVSLNNKMLLVEKLEQELKKQEVISNDFINMCKKLHRPSDHINLLIDAEVNYISLIRERINNLIKYIEKCIELSNMEQIVNNPPYKVACNLKTGEITKVIHT